MTAVVSVEKSLFATLDPPRLAATKCQDCGTVTFPVQRGCPKCAGADVTTIELPERGALWTWTVQSFEPKFPYHPPATGYQPYGVGYIDLGEVIVESRLTGPLEHLRVGTPMRLVLEQMWDDADGNQVVSYAFEAETTHG